MTFLGPQSRILRDAPSIPHGAGSDIAGRLWRWLRRPVLIERQRRSLDRLSDHVLKDIGLSRGDIDSIATHLIDKQADTTRRWRGR